MRKGTKVKNRLFLLILSKLCLTWEVQFFSKKWDRIFFRLYLLYNVMQKYFEKNTLEEGGLAADGIDMALRFLDLIFCIFQIYQMKINDNDY